MGENDWVANRETNWFFRMGIAAKQMVGLMMIAPLGTPHPLSLLPLRLGNQPTAIAQLGSMVNKGLPTYPLTDPSVLERAYDDRASNMQVMVQGRVVALLSDDTYGDRHQRFIIELPNGQTLLIAHNIDIAPRVSGLTIGDLVYVYGEYEWNEDGGVIHWTHHDPDGGHIDGWIERNGIRFQ